MTPPTSSSSSRPATATTADVLAQLDRMNRQLDQLIRAAAELPAPITRRNAP